METGKQGGTETKMQRGMRGEQRRRETERSVERLGGERGVERRSAIETKK